VSGTESSGDGPRARHSSAGATDCWTEATTGYWQSLTPDVPEKFSRRAPYRFGYPVRLPGGSILVLPLRRLPDGQHALASFIANQASHAVVEALVGHMTVAARALQADLVVGLPTLGLVFGAAVAERLGHSRYLPLGASQKFWYDRALSEPVSSVTSPGGGKQLFLDPNMRPLLAGCRVVVVDDAISTGSTILAARRLLVRAGADVAGVVVAMKQTDRWAAALEAIDVALPEHVRGVFGCPLFTRGADGWWPVAATEPSVP
jgi:adenine/guanine phosphoribosyltransferase-like PRPP-binding protein